MVRKYRPKILQHWAGIFVASNWLKFNNFNIFELDLFFSNFCRFLRLNFENRLNLNQIDMIKIALK
jgi:hypothetical protein